MKDWFKGVVGKAGKAKGKAPAKKAGAKGPSTKGPSTRAPSAATRGPASRVVKARWRIPLIGSKSTPTQFKIVGSMMAAFLIATIGASSIYVVKQGYTAEQAKVASDMATLAQKLAKNAGLSSQGRGDSFSELRSSQAQFEKFLHLLVAGGDNNGVKIPAASDGSREADSLAKLGAVWKSANEDTNLLSDSEESLSQFQKAIRQISALDQDTFDSMTAVGSALTLSGDGDKRQAMLAAKLPLLVQRMGKNANNLFASNEIDAAAAFLLGKDVREARAILDGLEKGSDFLGVAPVRSPEALKAVQKAQSEYNAFAPQVSFVQRNYAPLNDAKKANRALAESSERLTEATEKLNETYVEVGKANGVFLLVGFLFGALFLASIALLVKIFADEGDAARRAAEVSQENDAQQRAVLTLLDEIANLADGDLTVKATVNESFTGAIADAINFTSGELRSIIVSVQETVQRVGEQSEETNRLTGELRSSSREQYDKLNQTGEAIVKISTRMDEIAQTSNEAVGVARQSLDVSQNGIGIVNDSIKRMNTIRDTIQDTSKKIKLLGESSTAIGEVTGLIRDITKQINILALNAAIQAASAGEAGRGFAVVAQEVQRLALSSSDAARRIDDLVANIQNDAKGAVAAMEKSTQEVVDGARLTDKAGLALREIGEATGKVAEVIEQIASQVEAESEEATNVSLDMRLLQEYTETAVKNAESSADSVEKVKQIAGELRESVSGFKV